jgi:hypothetical protein
MDPTLGRWTSRDPVLFLGKQWNLYVYAESSPLRFEDRSGLFFDAPSAAGYSGGAVTAAGLICLGFSNPVGWGLIGAGIALGGLSYYLSGESVADHMNDADEALEPVRDRRRRGREKWDEYEDLVKN